MGRQQGGNTSLGAGVSQTGADRRVNSVSQRQSQMIGGGSTLGTMAGTWWMEWYIMDCLVMLRNIVLCGSYSCCFVWVLCGLMFIVMNCLLPINRATVLTASTLTCHCVGEIFVQQVQRVRKWGSHIVW